MAIAVLLRVALNVEFEVAFNVEFKVAATPTFHSSIPKHANKITGRKEKGALKRKSLNNDEIVSQENHLKEISPVSLLNLYGMSPIQYMNMWIPDSKYCPAFFIFSSVFAFWSTGATFMLQVQCQRTD